MRASGAGRCSVLLGCLLLIFAAGCGDGGGHSGTTGRPSAQPPQGGADEGTSSVGTIASDGPSARRAAAERAVRSYIRALNARDGAAACSLLMPGVIGAAKLPVDRGSCSASLKASIGRAEQPGHPRFKSVRLRAVRTALQGDRARVTATVVVVYVGNEGEPSVEDDVIYLSRAAGRWLITRPTLTLYRAIGRADVGPDVLAPPPG